MGYLINETGIVRKTFVLSNVDVQNISAATPILITQSTGRPFAIISCSAIYINGTTNFETTPTFPTCTLGYSAGGINGVWQDNSGSISLAPNHGFNFVVSQDPSQPAYGPVFRDDEIYIEFDGSYVRGNGELKFDLVGIYI
jgi:hypothetical protein